MKRILLAALALTAAGCGDPVNPLEQLPVYPGYSLISVDGQFPPLPEPAGGSLLSAGLRFLEYTPTAPGEGGGVVQYATHVLGSNNQVVTSIVRYDFTIADDVLRIDLCPRLASCVAPAELTGPVTGRTGPLVLRQYLAGQAGSVLRFDPALPA